MLLDVPDGDRIPAGHGYVHVGYFRAVIGVHAGVFEDELAV